MKRNWWLHYYLFKVKPIVLSFTLACSFCFHTTHAQLDIGVEAIPAPTESVAIEEDSQDSVSFSFFGGSDFDSSFAGSGEVWLNQWGLSTELFDSESSNAFGLPADSEYYNFDVKRRFGSSSRSNFELGLGWQEFNVDSQFDASGPRVSLGGNLKLLKSFSVYGSTSYFPDLDDTLSDSDATAYEFEAGLLYSPLPSFSLKAGYRVFNLELENTEIDSLNSNSGFLLGSDWSW